MDVRRSKSVAEFMALAGDFLAAREAEHNLIFGICSQIEADPSQYAEAPYLGAVLDGGRVVAAAIQTPPWRLVLSVMDDAAAAGALAADLAGRVLPGTVGPAEAAAAFAAAWGRVAGIVPRLARHERAFQLRQVKPPRPAPGEMVRAGSSDRAILRDWVEAFHEEAIGAGNAPPQDYEAMADHWIRGLGRTAWLWVDDRRPVSLSGTGGLTPHGTRVGPVYTPPELRGRGYASNLVAAASQRMLDEGRTFVFLFTDLANPTANKVYQDIGYEPVIDIDEYNFRAT
ncbi:MAG: GNAT family N-acetyltransferase [Chloroflexi bacterium]|nr:GNAT family N-acetyltransferase [Chloroflexota bacterium]